MHECTTRSPGRSTGFEPNTHVFLRSSSLRRSPLDHPGDVPIVKLQEIPTGITMTTTPPTRDKEDISPAEKSEAFDGAGPDPIEPRLQPELRNQAGSERPLHRKYGILPETVKAGGNWKKLEITNVAAALRAGRGCQAGPSGFVWKRPESVNFDYSEEVLERWRNN